MSAILVILPKWSVKCALIGSQRTPPAVLSHAERFLAPAVARAGIIVRSGHAPGFDKAAERGARIAGGKIESFLPWQHFENSDSPLYAIPAEAFKLAEDVWGKRKDREGIPWRSLKPTVRKLLARDMQQVLGRRLDDPVRFIACWSDGDGGTEMALSLARRRHIPVINYFDLMPAEVIPKINEVLANN